jgi:hypothetical protein
VAPIIVRRSFVVSQHTLAATLVTITLLMVLVFQAALPAANLWPSFFALLPMLGLLLVADRVGVVLWSLTYLVVGGVGVYIYALGLLGQVFLLQMSDGFTFLSVKVALILVGGVVLGIGAGIAGAVAGYLTAELAVGLAQTQAGLPLFFDIPAFVILLATIVIISIFGMNNPRQMLVLPRLQRAAQDDHLATLRFRIEVKAATLMHDTVLNHLAAISDARTDSLDPVLLQQIRRDVEALSAEEWLAEGLEKAESADRATHMDWQQSGLFTAIREGRLLGLDITVSGDLTALSRLERETSVAVGLAVKQCLVNVLNHAGTREAEVSVYSSESEISVMVIDSGRGFAEAAANTDRLGLRSSVRKRIELVGGTVKVWSTPGRGTSIMISVPTMHGRDSSFIEPSNEAS